MSSRRRQGRALLVGTLIMLILGFGIHRGLMALAAMPKAVLPSTVLVVGTMPSAGPSGVVEVAAVLLLVNHHAGRTSVLIIPPNTRISLAGYGPQEIGQAYAFGGSSLLGQTVASLLHVPPFPVAVMPLPALSSEIDQLGGVRTGATAQSGAAVVAAWRGAAGSSGSAAVADTVAVLAQAVQGGQWLKAPLFAEEVWTNTSGSLPWSALIAEVRVWGEGPSLVAEVLPGAPLHFSSGAQWLVVPADAARDWSLEQVGIVSPQLDRTAEAKALALEQGK